MNTSTWIPFTPTAAGGYRCLEPETLTPGEILVASRFGRRHGSASIEWETTMKLARPPFIHETNVSLICHDSRYESNERPKKPNLSVEPPRINKRVEGCLTTPAERSRGRSGRARVNKYAHQGGQMKCVVVRVAYFR